MVFRESRENLAIEHDAALFECPDEATVRREACGTDARVDANVPESAEITLFVLAVAERVGSGFEYRVACGAFFVVALLAIPLDLLEDTAAAFQCMYSSFYS